MKNKPVRIIISIYTLFLFLINFFRIFDSNFWGDEGFTIRLSRMSVRDMLIATARDVHPPLYYLGAIAGYKLFGDQGWMYHLLSLIPYAVILIIALTVIYDEFGETAALLFVTFASILKSSFRYNVEARMYSLAALFILLAFLEFRRMTGDGKTGGEKRGSHILFTLFSLCAAYTHYYAMISVAVFYGALLILAICKRESFKNVLMIYIATVLGYLPWLSMMITTFERTADSFWMTEYDGIFKSLCYLFDTDLWQLSMLLFIVTLGLLFFFIYADLKGSGGDTGRLSGQTVWYITGISSAIVTIAAGQLISVFIRPSYITRYVYPISIVVWLILSIEVSRISKPKLSVISVSVLMVFLCGICGLSALRQTLGDYSANRECIRTWDEMRTMVGSGDIIITDIDHMSWTLLDYYIPDNEHVLDDSNTFVPETGRKYWFLTSGILDENDISWLEQNDMTYELKIDSGILGTTDIFLYELIP